MQFQISKNSAISACRNQSCPISFMDESAWLVELIVPNSVGLKIAFAPLRDRHRWA
jgi:hypothetical protein